MTLKLDLVHEQFPGLPANALEFFALENSKDEKGNLRPRTVTEFALHIARPGNKPNEKQFPPFHRLNLILRRMADRNLLKIMTIGHAYEGGDASYICEIDSEKRESLKRNIDYVVYGFPVVYRDLRDSVVPIVHSSSKGDQIGSSFLRTHQTLLTAAHCLESAETISIRGVTEEQFADARVFLHRNEALDLAAVRFPEPILTDKKEIDLGAGAVLDDVLVMGYPNVPGFTEILAAEKAAISARITGVRGAIASSAKEIFANTSLFLITARVRGGFSGGPVVNANGLAVGVVARQPISAGEDRDQHNFYEQYDNLGYGVAIPSEIISTFLRDCQEENEETLRIRDSRNSSMPAYRNFEF